MADGPTTLMGENQPLAYNSMGPTLLKGKVTSVDTMHAYIFYMGARVPISIWG